MSIFTWGVQSLVSAKPEDPKPERFNPRPPGVIREGSATAAVLAFLLAHRGKRFAAYQVIHATGCTQKATSWALVYLQQQGLIETSPDPRNERYLRYGSNEKTTSAQISEPRTQASEKGMARDETPMSGAGIQGLAKVRRSGDSDRAAVGGQFRAVSVGHGAATDTGALAGPTGHLSALRAGQCDLDAARPADEPQAVLSEGGGERAIHDGSPGAEGAGQPNSKQHSRPLASRLQPGATNFAKTGQACTQDLVERSRLVAESVGSLAGSALQDPVLANHAGHAA